MPILTAETQCFPADLLGGLAMSAEASGRLSCGEASFGEVSFGEDRTWWVMHTKPRQEKSLARDLLAREIPFYLPQVRKTSVVRGRKQSSYIPLFPSYVFVFANDLERYNSMTTNRIAQFLPVASPQELTHQLFSISRLVESGAPLTIESRLKAGDAVRVKGGALAGVEGIVMARRRKCRLIVAVKLIQQGVSIEIDDHLLEPI